MAIVKIGNLAPAKQVEIGSKKKSGLQAGIDAVHFIITAAMVPVQLGIDKEGGQAVPGQQGKKQADLNAASTEAACRIIEGTARSMGLLVEG